jgi:alpha-tubulin suppressor-like RCC1 family protein
VVATATGNSDVVALLANGQVWAWGNNRQGQLGTGNTKSSLVPVPATSVNSYVRGQAGATVTALAAGGNKAFALLSNGSVIAWGLNADGELGAGSSARRSLTPLAVKGLPADISAISSGNLFGDALTSNGKVYDWGNNAFGQLGDGTTVNSSVAVQVSGLSNAVQISAGGDAPGNGHNMALLGNGTVMTWGDNANGQLGDGTLRNSSVPVAVTKLTDGTTSDVTSIAAGGLHSMALLSDGSLMTWGANANGQLGNGTTADSPVPVKVLSKCQIISAGAVDSLAAVAP